MASIQAASATPASPGSSSYLEADLASVIRVRNRLAQSNDTSLPKIIAGLLPRLLERLDRNSIALATLASDDGSREEDASIRNLINIHLLGTLAHALERLRGNRDVASARWLPEVLTALDATTDIVRTLALSFLQVGIPRCTKADLSRMEEERAFSVIGALLRTVDRLYRSVCEKDVGEDSSSRRTDLRTASWLCFDTITVLSGMRPLVDWDVDCHFEEDRHYLPSAEDASGFDAEPALASTLAQRAADEDGSGVFDMFLDLFLFSPRLLHENLEPNHGITSEGIARMCHRLKGKVSWDHITEDYLSRLKSACFRYIAAPAGSSLLSASKANMMRAFMFAVLFSGSNSKVGKLSTEYLRSPPARDFHSIQMNCSLFILVLGDDASRPILQNHTLPNNLWLDLLGARPRDGSAMTRLPLPTSVASRVLHYTVDRVHLSPGMDKDELRLFLALIAAIRVQTEFQTKQFWGIRLIYKVCKQLETLHMEPVEAFLLDFYQKSLAAAVTSLSVVSDPHDTDNATGLRMPPERPIPEAQDANHQLDMGIVPRRRDAAFNQLMTKHRRSLRQKRLRDDDAIETRECAYDLVARLAPRYGMQIGGGGILDIPIMLFRCAVYEDGTMQAWVSQCLNALLSTLKSKMSAEENSDIDTSFLLPALMAAACCESPSARIASARWADELLLTTDPLAAYHIGGFLSSDSDAVVAKIGKSLVSGRDSGQLHRVDTDPGGQLVFTDFSEDAGVHDITEELNARIGNLSKALHINSSAASVLLHDFDFDLATATAVFQANPERATKKCGIQSRCHASCELSDTERKNNAATFSCGICYDDELDTSTTYALPCGHRFCVDCWRGYVENQFLEGPMLILSATCPSQACTERVTGVDIQRVAPDFVQKWRKSLLRHFVERDRMHRFCPGTDCNMVVQTPTRMTATPYKCESCQECFCYECGEVPHVPARCSDFDVWNRIFGSSKFWIKKNTKPCPGCSAPVEKDGGCNHITCSRCQHEFCWLCLARLDSHLMAHTCNRYDPIASADSDDEKRNLFFTERFQAHENAEYFAKKQVEENEERLQKLSERFHLLGRDDIDSLSKAGDKLFECRRFLKYSYVAAYGLRNDEVHRETFQTHQGVLELFTEQLSRLYEMSLEAVYVDTGENGLMRHLRAIVFYCDSLEGYIERMGSFAKRVHDPEAIRIH